MARRILRHAEQGAIFREAAPHTALMGVDLASLGLDEVASMLGEHFSNVGESLNDAHDTFEGAHDLTDAMGHGLDGVHYHIPSSPAGMALLSGGELGRQWSNSARRFVNQYHQQHGQLPSPHHLMNHAQGWAAANVLPYVNPEMHHYINPARIVAPHSAPPSRQGPPRDRLDEALAPTPSHWDDTLLGGPPTKKRKKFFGATATNRYLLLPHWDPHACVDIILDHAQDMAHHTATRTAGYAVSLELKDGTKDAGENTHLFPDARKSADALALKHKLTLKEMARSPDDMGRVPMWLPAYAEGDNYVGNVKIDNADADYNPYGPHAEQYAYSSKRTALPQATPELMNMAKSGGFTLHDHVGDGPTSGYMVSRNKNTETTMPLGHLTPKLVNDFVAKHTRELTSPENYLGGWLDGKNFYLDISSHRPTIDRAASDAVGGDQLGIYDLGKGETIYTPDAVEQAGDIGLAYKPRVKDPLTAAVVAAAEQQHYPASLPDHDYLQHHLGDAEHWEEDPLTHTAATHGQGFSDLPEGLEYSEEAPKSNHGAQIYKDTQGQHWLVKHAPKKAHFLVDGDLATSQIQHQSGLETPATFKTDLGKGPASAQYMYDATDAFPDQGVIDPHQVNDADRMTLQKHHALDWLLGNHDSHAQQFIRIKGTGQIVGIDKSQSFKHFSQDRLHWNFHPNAVYNEKEPVYNTLYRHMAQGGKPLFDPRDGELGKYVQGLQDIPDQEYADILKPYAAGAAKAGQLAVPNPHNYDGFDQPRFPHNKVEDFLNAAVERKNKLMDHLGDLWDRAKAHADTGTKIAKVAHSFPLAPSPAEMELSLEQPEDRGSHGSMVHIDKTGSKWLVKTPHPATEFMVPLDVATSALMTKVGLKSPPVHAVPVQGNLSTAVKWMPNAQQVWSNPPHLSSLAPKDLLTIQKHHAFDWLIANHDSHVGNWLRDGDGDLIGIDKGQSMKYFGRDRLSYNFHPNYYAREPIYNNLWREYASGMPGQMLDPREGKLGGFIQALQDIPDDVYAGLFAPYAHAATHAGVLATGSTKGRPIEPDRKLGAPIIPENDPDAFLQALVARKHDLMHDLGTYYDKMTARRQKYLGGGHGDD